MVPISITFEKVLYLDKNFKEEQNNINFKMK